MERAAAQQRGAALLDQLGDEADLLLALDRAGAGRDGEIAAADLHAPDLDDRVGGVELAVGVLIRLLDAFDVLDDVQRFEQVDVDRRRVADESHNRLRGALAHMHLQILALQPRDEVLDLILIGVFL